MKLDRVQAAFNSTSTAERAEAKNVLLNKMGFLKEALHSFPYLPLGNK